MISLLAAALLYSATPVQADPSPYFLDEETVVMVNCTDWTGSAFYVGNGEYITARHVVRDDKGKIVKCDVAGKPITVLQVGDIHDYAIFKAKVYLPFREIISCDGFKEGQDYYAEGYAMGRPWVVTQRLIGSSVKVSYGLDENGNGKPVTGADVRGSTTEGQSGGPVKDHDGRVVGIVSAGEDGGETMQELVSLSDTPLCKKAQA
jgi:S1-C subfamily serine protease